MCESMIGMGDACASAGLRPDGRLLGLNSYENRVYQVYMEEGAPVVFSTLILH